MSKINNKLILIFGILAFILGLLLASPAYASRSNGVPFYLFNYPTTQYTYPVEYTYNYPIQYNTPITYTTPVYNSPTIIEGCEGRNTGFSTTTGQSCIENYVVTPITTIIKVPAVTTTTEKNNDAVASDINENYGSLTANALLGSNSFMPSGLVQWIFFIALIVAIIFLWRYVHAEDRYMSEPLKHA